LYAFPSEAVDEMASLARVHPVPEVPPHIRGVIDLRGQVVTVVDLRVRLGLPSAADDLRALLATFEAREQDHRKWIDALDVAIRERRDFTLATDPHRCAFGRWYDSLKTNNVMLATQLKKIDQPHQRVHRRGAEALALSAAGQHDQAQALARDIRERDLAGTLALFAETRKALTEAHREVVVVARGTTGRFAVAVDGIEAVERLDGHASGDVDALDTLGGSALITAIRTRARDNRMVMVVDLRRVLAAA
jgi:chemotaxis signal transduction protein